jgi:hypothetical protein
MDREKTIMAAVHVRHSPEYLAWTRQLPFLTMERVVRIGQAWRDTPDLVAARARMLSMDNPALMACFSIMELLDEVFGSFLNDPENLLLAGRNGVQDAGLAMLCLRLRDGQNKPIVTGSAHSILTAPWRQAHHGYTGFDQRLLGPQPWNVKLVEQLARDLQGWCHDEAAMRVQQRIRRAARLGNLHRSRSEDLHRLYCLANDREYPWLALHFSAQVRLNLGKYCASCRRRPDLREISAEMDLLVSTYLGLVLYRHLPTDLKSRVLAPLKQLGSTTHLPDRSTNDE